MAKDKSNGGVQNRAIYSRVSFLQQAAAFLSSASQKSAPDSRDQSVAAGPASPPAPSLQGMSRRLVADLRAVSLKTRIRLTPAMKQGICKFCDSVLLEGQTCTSSVENQSRGGRKPWADVLVRKCHTCGRQRRYPVNAPRPKRRTERGDAPDAITTSQPSKQKRKAHGG